MARVLSTPVDVPVVLGQKVDVVEDKAREVVEFEGLQEADVQQERSVELVAS